MIMACLTGRHKPAFLALCLIGATTLAPGATARDTEPEILEPTTPWNLHGTEQSCLLSRSFESGGSQAGLSFERFAQTQYFRLTFTGDRLKRFRSARKLTVAFGSEGWVHEISEAQFGRTADGISAIIVMRSAIANWTKGISPEDFAPPEAEAKITQVALEHRGKAALVFATGSLGKPF